MDLFKTSVILAMLALCATAATVSENPLSESVDDAERLSGRPPYNPVYTIERYYRTYEDGTIETKLVLSNGLSQFQRIYDKEYNGVIIRAYEGYYSTPLPDGTYSTVVYVSDERGYRVIRQGTDSNPPTLPTYPPYVPKGQS